MVLCLLLLFRVIMLNYFFFNQPLIIFFFNIRLILYADLALDGEFYDGEQQKIYYKFVQLEISPIDTIFFCNL